MEAPPGDQSWRADFADEGYLQDPEVESMFRQPFDYDQDHGEQEAWCGDGNQGPEATNGIRESRGERGDNGVRLQFQSTFQQPPVRENYQKRHVTPQQDPLPDSIDDLQIEVLESISTTARSSEVQPIEMQQTVTPSFNTDPGENNGDQTHSTQPADDASTQRPYCEAGTQAVEPTFKDACGEERKASLLLTRQQYIIRKGSEELKSTVERPSSADGTQRLQGIIRGQYGVQSVVQSQPTVPRALRDGSAGEGEQSLQKTSEEGCANVEDEIREHVEYFLHQSQGMQFLQHLEHWIHPSLCATDDAYQARTFVVDTEGSGQDQGVKLKETHIPNSKQQVDSMLSSQTQDDGSLPAQLAQQWHSGHEWYNSFLSMSLQNDWYNAENPSGECSSYAEHVQQMTGHLIGSGYRSLSVPRSNTPMSNSSPCSQNAPLSTPAKADGDSSHTQLGSSVAAEAASHDAWPADGCFSQTQDDTSCKYATADLVSQMTSPQIPLDSQENWQYTPITPNLALENESDSAHCRMQIPPLLQNITRAKLQAASNSAIGWGWSNTSQNSTVQISRDGEENVSSEHMPTPAGAAHVQDSGSHVHAPAMHWDFVEELPLKEPLQHRSDGDVEQQVQSGERPQVEMTSYQGADEMQQLCTCEECQAQQGTGTVHMTAEFEGYDEQPQQSEQCACEVCHFQNKGTVRHVTSEGGHGHEALTHPLEERWQMGFQPQGFDEYQQQQERWQDLGDGTSMRVFEEDVEELQDQERQIALGTYSHGDNHEERGHSEERGHNSTVRQQVQGDRWQEGFSDQQYSQSEGGQMPPDEGPINTESESGDDLEQQDSEEEWVLNFDGCDETSERWQKGHALLKKKLTLWKRARFRARIVTHPLFPHLLQTHVDCIRMMTPASKQEDIDQQLENIQTVYDKYLPFAPQHPQEDDIHIDQFLRKLMVDMKNYKTALENNVKVQATAAYAQLWQIERTLFQLTGMRIPDELESGPTMSEDSENDGGDESDTDMVEGTLDEFNHDGHDHDFDMDAKDYGPTAADRAAMEKIREELISRLGHENYRKQIKEVRDEILRKRRAGKLPDGTTDVLKTWWEAHSKWPYPTEEEKEQLIKATGLELKQVNNWFINQRKRNWHNNPLSSNNKDKGKAEETED